MRSATSIIIVAGEQPIQHTHFSFPYTAGLVPTSRLLCLSLLAILSRSAGLVAQADSGSYVVKNFQFVDGESLPELRLQYITLGTPPPKGRAGKAVLILHATGSSGHQFLVPSFQGELFGPGQPLDTSTHYLILPDAIGHGGSSKPSNGLRTRFPRYTYQDMVRAQYQLITEHLGVKHLEIVLGTSMGCMHSWVWAETYPDFMDGVVPLACIPTQIAGRNRLWRRMAAEAIRSDPTWQHGQYNEQPRGLLEALHLTLMVGGSPRLFQHLLPTRDSTDAWLAAWDKRVLPTADANDLLYALESSREYDPRPKLSGIRARVLAINFADDQINPPEIGLMAQLIPEVKHARYVLIPASDSTHGHGTHTFAGVWKSHLQKFLQSLGDRSTMTRANAQRAEAPRESTRSEPRQ